MAELLTVSSPPHPPRSAADLFGDATSEARPLWFDRAAFHRSDFDPEPYVEALRHSVPLEALSAELRAHLSGLRAELVDLVNRDYADFVALGARLVDTGGAAERMRGPLADLRARVSTTRASIEAALATIRVGLQQRADATVARELLERLLDTAHVVSKVEKLIKELPSADADLMSTDASPIGNDVIRSDISLQHLENGTDLRETQGILLERIASEMNRLKFYTSHSKNLPFIVNMERRIRNATLLLDMSLRHCFVKGLKLRDTSVIYNCLRAYAAIDSTSVAEELYLTTIVSPLVQKVIPYSQPRLLGGVSMDQLEEDYQQIMQVIEEDCKFLLEISSSANSGLHVFNFLSNSILKEVLYAIQKGKPGVFSPGRPTEFLKNFNSSMGFLSYLEGYCKSRSTVAKFRSSSVYVNFMKQWNIGVYFSLRFQEIAGSLDSVLRVSAITPVGKLHECEENLILYLKQSRTLLESLRSCWSADVLVHSFSDKFLRLTLQLLSRYSTWLSSGLEARRSRNTNVTNPYTEWAVAAHAEDFIYVMHDLRCLVSELSGNYIGHVLQILQPSSAELLDLVKGSILQAGKSLEGLLPSVGGTIIDAIVEKSIEVLRQLKGISATYRMTNKLAVRHSPYVSGVLHPLKEFLHDERVSLLTKDGKDELLFGTAEKITNCYYELAADLVNVARKTESSLQRLRQGAQRRVGASSDALDNNVSDTEKISMQLFLDIQEYGRNLASIGVKAADIGPYCSLWHLVAPKDRQRQIAF